MAEWLAQLIFRALCFGQEYVDVGQDVYERQFQDRRLASIKEAAKSLGFSLVAKVDSEVATA